MFRPLKRLQKIRNRIRPLRNLIIPEGFVEKRTTIEISGPLNRLKISKEYERPKIEKRDN